MVSAVPASTHMQDALENVFAQREIIFTHRLTLDESNSCTFETYDLVRVAEDVMYDL